MENQTAVAGFRVPGRGRSNCFADAAWTAEFVREYFADAGTDFRADLGANLLEQARPILARDKLAAEEEQVKARMFCDRPRWSSGTQRDVAAGYRMANAFRAKSRARAALPSCASKSIAAHRDFRSAFVG